MPLTSDPAVRPTLVPLRGQSSTLGESSTTLGIYAWSRLRNFRFDGRPLTVSAQQPVPDSAIFELFGRTAVYDGQPSRIGWAKFALRAQSAFVPVHREEKHGSRNPALAVGGAHSDNHYSRSDLALIEQFTSGER